MKYRVEMDFALSEVDAAFTARIATAQAALFDAATALEELKAAHAGERARVCRYYRGMESREKADAEIGALGTAEAAEAVDKVKNG